MKFYDEFRRTGLTFVERVGDPDEFHAAMGHIALAFSYLEDTARNLIVLLSGTTTEMGHIMTAELSFRQKLDVLGSLVRYRLSTLTEPLDDIHTLEQSTEELFKACHRAEELRNMYFHSSYTGDERAKFSAKARHGLRVQRESVDSSRLLDVADYIVYIGMELEHLPVFMGIADLTSRSEDSISYSKKGAVVATFKFGEIG